METNQLICFANQLNDFYMIQVILSHNGNSEQTIRQNKNKNKTISLFYYSILLNYYSKYFKSISSFL